MSKRRKYQVWHCTDTKAGREVSKEDLIQWQIKEQNWSRLGYEKMIHIDGTSERLIPDNNDNIVDLLEIANGVGTKDIDGEWVNHVSDHIVMVGGRDKDGNYADTRTDPQKAMIAYEMRKVVRDQDDIMIAGHYQFDAEKKWYCPGFDIVEFALSIGIHRKNIYLSKSDI